MHQANHRSYMGLPSLQIIQIRRTNLCVISACTHHHTILLALISVKHAYYTTLDMKIAGHGTESTAQKLARTLYLGHVVSTHTSSATWKTPAQALPEQGPYTIIGSGECGTIYDIPAQQSVIKIMNKNPRQRADGRVPLWQDFLAHRKINVAFKTMQIKCRVPYVDKFITIGDEEGWTLHARHLPLGTVHKYGIVSERIRPVPAWLREDLIDQFCPPAEREQAKKSAANKNCILQILLGRRSRMIDEAENLSGCFSLNNFGLDLDMMETIKWNITATACAMADALAVMHWKAGVDAMDVEYVIGTTAILSEDLARTRVTLLDDHDLERLGPVSTHEFERPQAADFTKRQTSVWVLDFDQCSNITREADCIAQLVDAYYFAQHLPRPAEAEHQDAWLWEMFSQQYVERSHDVIETLPLDEQAMQQMKKLPEMFVEALVDARTKKSHDTAATSSKQGKKGFLGGQKGFKGKGKGKR